MNSNDRLAKSVALGRKRYIFVYGVLGWGLLTASLFAAWSFYANEKLSIVEVVVPFIAFPIGGVFWGAFMWSILKKKHDDAQ